MTFKSAMSAIGNGALNVATVIHNSPIDTRIAEIDEEIVRLQQERATLAEKRIND
jgi:uncharacterized small protein (DUF1192 family)